MNKLLRDMRDGGTSLQKSSTTILAFVTAAMSYRGYSMISGSDWSGQSTAITLAIGVAALFVIFWRAAQIMIASEERSSHQLAAIGLIICLLPLMVSISSWSNVTAIAGHSAIQMHLEKSISSASTTLDVQFQNSSAIQGLLPDLQRESAVYRKLAKDELKHGVLTGVPGKGTVVSFLDATAERLEALEQDVSTHLKDVRKVDHEARKLVARARKSASSDEPVEQRLDATADTFDQINGLLSGIDSKSVAASVERTLKALPGGVESLIKFSRNSNTRARQKEALSTIESTLANTASILGEVTRDIAALPDPDPIALSRISAMEAVGKYATSFIPAWGAGLAIDVSPIFVLLLMTLQNIGLTREERAQRRVDNVTTADRKDSARAEEQTSRLEHPSWKIRRDNEWHFGLEGHSDRGDIQ